MIEAKAPNPYKLQLGATVFLAGSIEMGVADRWQDRVVRALADTNTLVLNPRRDTWDSSWVQSADNPQFAEQVNWEMDGLNTADVIVFYFDPTTKSPITLMELGLHAEAGNVIVCCPEGFWRKGNVDILCKRYRLQTTDNLEHLITKLLYWVR